MQLQPLNKPKAISALKANLTFSLDLILMARIELQQKSQQIIHLNIFFQ